MTHAPKLRWFRFSLRTLFVVVTVLAALLALLGWELKFIRARRAYEARLVQSFKNNEAGWATPYPYSRFLNGTDVVYWETTRTASVPFWRQWLGDEPFGLVYIPATWSENEVNDAKALFPEALVVWRRDLIGRKSLRLD